MNVPEGFDARAVERLLGRAQREIDEGLLPSCQLAFARNGEVVLDETLGDARPGSRYVLFSATKPVVLSAVWILLGEGALDRTRRVAEYVPEFGANGKDAVTVDQVLSNTAGFQLAPFPALEWDDRDARRARFAAWRLSSEPGTRWEYHLTSAYWVLAELIERVSGGDFREFLVDRVLGPLGLRRLRVGVPMGEPADINRLVATGEPATPDDPAVLAVGVPGLGGVSNAADLVLFYQALLHDEQGLWDPDVLAHGSAHLGDSGDASRASAFGQGGAGGQVVWAYPATGVSIAFPTNGIDLHEIRQYRRTVAIGRGAAACASP